MIFRILLFSVLCFNGVVTAQILYEYPEGQDFYEGGIPVFNRDFIEAVKNNNLQPCSNENEFYTMAVLVNPDKKINIVKDPDTININQNKCAFEFVKKALPDLKRWKPAVVDGNPVKAIASFSVRPSEFFQVEKPVYTENTNPEFPGGMNNFRMIMGDIFSRHIKTNKNSLTEVRFVVGVTGDMEDVVILGDYSEKEKTDLISKITRIKKKWKPATIDGKPVRFRMVLPLRQNFDFDWERKKFEEKDGFRRTDF